MDRVLSRIMMPLLENLSPSECLTVGKEQFQLPDLEPDPSVLFSHLLSRDDWVTVVLSLYVIGGHGCVDIDMGIIEKLAMSPDWRICQTARWVLQGQKAERNETEHQLEDGICVPERILHLRGIRLFEGLTVGELAAVASATEEADYPPGEVVVKKGESWDKMYLIVKGQISFIEGGKGEEGRSIELGRAGAGECFGEMALFDEVPQSVFIRTTEESRFMVLHKQVFEAIVKEYPEIALGISKELSARIRMLHEKVKVHEML
jgi:hypothetical protein